jgi:glycosyltransferase involved in cell wall biosynthesis
MLKHNIDHILIRDNQLFAYGWGFFPGEVIVKLTLTLYFAPNKDRLEIEAHYGQRRDDVCKVFSEIAEALNAGFVVLSDIGVKRVAHAELSWVMESGLSLQTAVNLTQIFRQGHTKKKSAHYLLLARKSLGLLRSAGPRALMRKVLRYRTGKPISGKSVTWDELKLTLKRRPFSVIVDHDIGGGANTYRNEYIQQCLAQEENVLLFGFHVASLQYFAELHQNQATHRFAITSIESFLFLLQNTNIQKIVYNCAVSFRQPLSVVDMLITLRQHVHCQLLVTVHDYFVICPSHFLIDHKGEFCDVPDEQTCQSCLSKSKDSFVSFSGEHDIVRWRQSWSALLSAADEVRLFSNASLRLLTRAYPQLDKSNWRVQPHTLHTAMEKIEILEKDDLHIGIVGVIGNHKGAKVIQDLVREILRRDSKVKITIIGTIEKRLSAQVVKVTGPYEADKLPALVRQSGANLFLFPSIWAETFSYVAHELVAMGVPFACFDFGAPADLARTYEYGLVLSSMQPETILNELENFWQEKIKRKNAIVWLKSTA